MGDNEEGPPFAPKEDEAAFVRLLYESISRQAPTAFSKIYPDGTFVFDGRFNLALAVRDALAAGGDRLILQLAGTPANIPESLLRSDSGSES